MEFKCSYNKTKGVLALRDQDATFTPKNGGAGVTIAYQNISAVNPKSKSPLAIFFRIIFFPFRVLGAFLILFAAVGGSSIEATSGKVRIITKDNAEHKFFLYKRPHRAISYLKSRISR